MSWTKLISALENCCNLEPENSDNHWSRCQINLQSIKWFGKGCRKSKRNYKRTRNDCASQLQLSYSENNDKIENWLKKVDFKINKSKQLNQSITLEKSWFYFAKVSIVKRERMQIDLNSRSKTLANLIIIIWLQCGRHLNNSEEKQLTEPNNWNDLHMGVDRFVKRIGLRSVDELIKNWKHWTIKLQEVSCPLIKNEKNKSIWLVRNAGHSGVKSAKTLVKREMSWMDLVTKQANFKKIFF